MAAVCYLPVRYRKKVENYPSAGPHANITGMRRIWGENAYIVKCGVYIYNVDWRKYYECKNGGLN